MPCAAAFPCARRIISSEMSMPRSSLTSGESDSVTMPVPQAKSSTVSVGFKYFLMQAVVFS